MNYDQPRQIAGGPNAGKWHYTSANDGYVHPIGYCSPYQECPACEGHSFIGIADCAECESKGFVELSPEDCCPGHATADEAREHHRAYLFDKTLRLAGRMADQQLRCEVCGEWTSGYAELDHSWMKILCDEHRIREVMESLIPEIGDSIHS